MKWRSINLSIFNKIKSKLKDKLSSKVDESEHELLENGLPIWLDKMIKKEEKENPESWIDESDFLILSLGFSMLLFAFLLLSEKFNMPDPLFLGAAIFSIYFLLVTSIRKKSKFKYVAIGLTFPVTINVCIRILESDLDISRINNALSLAAIGISLMYLPTQKVYERNHLERSKLKNQIIKDDHFIIKSQDEKIEKLQENIDFLRESIRRNNENKLKQVEEIQTIEIKESDTDSDRNKD